jgi:glycosyltransferase involved in cell wall biosynthesis
MRETYSLVISAYNEAARLPAVLAPLVRLPEAERITVVDDGSEDGTAEVARAWAARDRRIRLLRLPQNRGKGGAVVAGAESSPTDLVVLLDGDLVGLQGRHVRSLVEPVAAGRCQMTIGCFRGGRLATDFTQWFTPVLNGQRALRWSAFRDAPGLAASRGGAEAVLSRHARTRGYRVLRVPLQGMTHVMKPEKGPRLAGLLAHLRMYREIIDALLHG